MFKKIALMIGIMMTIAAPIAINALSAQPLFADAKTEIQGGINATGGSPEGAKTLNQIILDGVNTLLFVVGVLSVIIIILAGIYYIISAGDAGKIKKAKDTLTYAIVGLIIAILAYAIVNFVVGLF